MSFERNALFRDERIRARCGLLLSVFPDPEVIIQENGGVILLKFLFFTSDCMRSYGDVFGGRKSGKNRVWFGPGGAGSGFFGDRMGVIVSPH
jgi:hypothetical protein